MIHHSNPLLISSILWMAVCSLHAQEDQAPTLRPRLTPDKGHTAWVTSACFSSDEKYILTGSHDGSAKLWDARTGKSISEFSGSSIPITTAKFCPDGKSILTAGWDQSVTLWDLESRQTILIYKGHTNTINTVRFSPNGKHVLTSSDDQTAQIWNMQNGRPMVKFSGHTGSINDANYNPDGTLVVTASTDQTAAVWDCQTGRTVLHLIGHTSVIHSACFSPDAKYILTGSSDHTAILWDAKTGNPVNILSGHTAAVTQACFSPDGNRIVTASMDHTAKVWEPSTGELICSLSGHHGPILSVQYSPDGKYIFTTSTDQTSKKWDASNGELLITFIGHTQDVSSAQFNQDGSRVVTAGADHTAIIWNATNGKQVNILKGHTNTIYSIQFCPDGKHFSTALSNHSVTLWDLTTGDQSQKLIGHDGEVFSADFSPEGTYLVTGSDDNTARIWEVHSGKQLFELNGHSSPASVKYNPDGTKIVTASFDRTAKIWDAASGTLLFDLKGHKLVLEFACFSPDGNKVLTTSHDHTGKVWDAHSGKWLFDLTGHTDWVGYAQFSPDGHFILTTSADHTAKVWNANTGKLAVDLAGHTDWVWSAQYSSDGDYILTASADHTAKVWNARTGKMLHELSGHSSGVNSAQFSPDGKYIVTAGDDHSVKVWDSGTYAMIADFRNQESAILSAMFSPDGKYIVSRNGDGSIGFWSVSSLTALLTLYPLGLEDWAVIHPSGLFDATPAAMDWMYYLFGTEVIELEQLKERYYEPGLFSKAMAENGPLRNVDVFSTVQMYPGTKSFILEDTLFIHLKERNGGIGQVSLFINQKEVVPDINPHRDTCISVDLTQFDKYYLHDSINPVSIRVYNRSGWLKSTSITHDYFPEINGRKGAHGLAPSPDSSFHKPKLYGLVIGTSDYSGDLLDLRFADKDSKDIAHAIRQSAEQLFGAKDVHVEWFTSVGMPQSKLASKQNIKIAFDSIGTLSRAEDIFVLYLSGHGMMYGGTENEQFYYLTKDVRSGELTDPEIRHNYTISTEELTEWTRHISAQKQVMILDACSSGKFAEELIADRAAPSSQIRALDRMKDRTGMFVLAGCASNKVSYESSRFGQGLLTYSLLLGMSGAALANNREIDVMQLFQYARDKVPEFAKDIGGMQIPTLAFPTKASSFDIGIVNDHVHIPIKQIKPIFIRSSFQEEHSFNDISNLGEALDNQLMSDPDILFINSNHYKNAFSIKGRYSLIGNHIKVMGRLYKDDQVMTSFDLDGANDNIEELTDQIRTELFKAIH